ncbi:hypothetical protein A7U60_g9122 [Sanghuangporus baumii]|uniref:PH domain-containing protein n=1 Tax=Sanghuangporus baumii TaxID=108892 RepID=A0A9Q5HQ64_SANBA|nr:hypothetical protein A7U60_g9122 [Sanghuangporus baumii]
MSQPFIFKGDSDRDVELWIDAIEIYFIDNDIAEDNRIPFAFDHLSGHISACLMSLTGCLSGFRQAKWVWDWTKLKMALILMNEQIRAPTAEVGSELIARLLTFGRHAWPFVQAFLDEDEPSSAVNEHDLLMECLSSNFPEPIAYLRALSTVSDSQTSRTWDDGANFQPSRKVIRDLLLEFM